MRNMLIAPVLAVLLAVPLVAAELQTPVLAVHNAERSAVGVPPVVWNDKLAAHATAWARHLAGLGRLEHSAAGDRPGEGENLWMGTAGAYTPAEMAEAWAGEKKDFQLGAFPNVSKGGSWQVVGHYTQMIWRNTREIGCGMASGGGWDILVCRYGPPGNMRGERPF